MLGKLDVATKNVEEEDEPITDKEYLDKELYEKHMRVPMVPLGYVEKLIRNKELHEKL